MHKKLFNFWMVAVCWAACVLLVAVTAAFGGAPTQYYVDPSLGSDTGDGTVGTPWGRASGSVVQYALDTITQDTTDGDQINVKAGTDDVLTATLTTTTYGTPHNNYPLYIRGYTSTANDGGVGGMSGGGTYSIWNDAVADGVAFIDMHLHNCGSADIIAATDRFILFSGCELNNTTADAITLNDRGSVVVNCYIHNIGGYGINHLSTNAVISGCVFENGTNDMSQCVKLTAGTVDRCVFDIDGATDGIQLGADGANASNNSIYSAAGTGQGIIIGGDLIAVYNNLVEGFSGVGGVGIDATSDNRAGVFFGNSIYNCTTTYDTDITTTGVYVEAPESLGASPFTNAGSNDFTPVDTGSVKQGQWPQSLVEYGTAMRMWRGAIEPAEPAGGGGSTILIDGGLVK